MDGTDSNDTVTITHRFCGPPNVGNGGIVCSILAEHCGDAIEVSLRRPAPLDRALRVARSAEHGLALMDGDAPVAVARAADVDVTLPPLPTFEEVKKAGRHVGEHEHPFPNCFVCGPNRKHGDGLRVITAPVADRPGMVAAIWQPHDCFVDATGNVAKRYLWAALDCPGGIAAIGGAPIPIVLGRFTGRLEQSLPRDERCMVIGWQIAQSGRKHTTGSAIVTESGRIVGRAEAIWIELATASAVAA